MGKAAYTIIYVGLFGAVFMGILLHADQFKTAFGSVSSFFLSEMDKLEGNSGNSVNIKLF